MTDTNRQRAEGRSPELWQCVECGALMEGDERQLVVAGQFVFQVCPHCNGPVQRVPNEEPHSGEG